MSGLLARVNPSALALPAGILTLICLMIVPTPAVLLDVFFVLNIALSVAMGVIRASPASANRAMPTPRTWRRAGAGAPAGADGVGGPASVIAPRVRSSHGPI